MKNKKLLTMLAGGAGLAAVVVPAVCLTGCNSTPTTLEFTVGETKAALSAVGPEAFTVHVKLAKSLPKNNDVEARILSVGGTSSVALYEGITRGGGGGTTEFNITTGFVASTISQARVGDKVKFYVYLQQFNGKEFVRSNVVESNVEIIDGLIA